MPKQNLTASLVVTGNNSVAIPENFQGFSVSNLQLTAAVRLKDTSPVPLNDLLAGVSKHEKKA
ncbi:MAG: hypothetical protein HY848_11925 [Betaproteobacteria bacterium]|nr:hypothetical protein [Betaproteobacteria bacterium]